jgi:hypothetical protein
MRHSVSVIDGRPRQTGDGRIFGKQTPRPATVALEMGQNGTNALKSVGAEDSDKPTSAASPGCAEFKNYA